VNLLESLKRHTTVAADAGEIDSIKRYKQVTQEIIRP